MKLVSIIVPVYNVEKYLNRCINSIVGQSYKNTEIILVDDESPDNCPKMCDEWKLKDNRIIVIHKKKNGGLGYARNSGMSIARGEYITFIDSDDWIDNKHIESLVNLIEKNKSDCVLGGHTIVKANGKQIKSPIKLKKEIYNDEEIIEYIVKPLVGSPFDSSEDILLESSCCMNLYNKSIIDKNNIVFINEREAISEDLFFNINYFCNSRKISICNNCSYNYYENYNSISKKYNPYRFVRTKKYYIELKKIINSYNLDDCDYRLKRSFMTKVRIAIMHVVNSNLKTREKLKELKTIVGDSLVTEVIKDFPINNYKFGTKMYMKFLKNKNAILLYILVLIRVKTK